MTTNIKPATVSKWFDTRRWQGTPMHDTTVTRKDKAGRERLFLITLAPDDSVGAPWQEAHGHGPVEENDGRAKRPGEVSLGSGDRNRRDFYYDFAEACRMARRERWGWLPGRLEISGPLRREDGQATSTAGEVTLLGDPEAPCIPYDTADPRGPQGINAAIRLLYDHYRRLFTPRQHAALAARADYEYLSAWCRGVWEYVTVCITEVDENGEQISPGAEYLGGVESYITLNEFDYLDDMIQTVMDATDEANCYAEKRATQPRIQLPGGFTMAPRHPRANTAFKGKWMVAADEVWAALDGDPNLTFEDSRNCAFCVVGDDTAELVAHIING